METKAKRVLVVDDDDAIRNLVERILKRERYQVETARDGFEAIQKLQRNEYATILLDLMMPRVDGHGVLRYLVEERPAPKPPVIVMTANIAGAVEAEQAPVTARVLPKPFDIRDLVRHVRDCITPGEQVTA